MPKVALFFFTAYFFSSSGFALNFVSPLSSDQERRIEQLTTAFENSTTEFQYAYVENLHDGRGYTAGRVGFCTGTGDLLEVVLRYTALQPENEFRPYLNELKRLGKIKDQTGSADTGKLLRFPQAWKKAAENALFREAQDAEVEYTYFRPAVLLATSFGLKSALAIGEIYDAGIQHGFGNDPDSVTALMKRTERRLHGNPLHGVDEAKWMAEFLKIRRLDLLNPADHASQKVWADSIDRVKVYASLLKARNFNLEGPIQFQVYGSPFRVN